MTREQAENRVAWSMAYQYAGLAGRLTESGGSDLEHRQCAITLVAPTVYCVSVGMGMNLDDCFMVMRGHDCALNRRVPQALIDRHAEEGCQEWEL